MAMLHSTTGGRVPLRMEKEHRVIWKEAHAPDAHGGHAAPAAHGDVKVKEEHKEEKTKKEKSGDTHQETKKTIEGAAHNVHGAVEGVAGVEIAAAQSLQTAYNDLKTSIASIPSAALSAATTALTVVAPIPTLTVAGGYVGAKKGWEKVNEKPGFKQIGSLMQWGKEKVKQGANGLWRLATSPIRVGVNAIRVAGNAVNYAYQKTVGNYFRDVLEHFNLHRALDIPSAAVVLASKLTTDLFTVTGKVLHTITELGGKVLTKLVEKPFLTSIGIATVIGALANPAGGLAVANGLVAVLGKFVDLLNTIVSIF